MAVRKHGDPLSGSGVGISEDELDAFLRGEQDDLQVIPPAATLARLPACSFARLICSHHRLSRPLAEARPS